MTAMTLDPSLSLQMTAKESQRRVVIEDIDGLIKIYKDGQVERPDIVPRVTCSLPPEFRLMSRDLIIDKYTNIWARLYVPNRHEKLPLIVYFHGGGFCVGSASWSCYHEFLAKLSAKANCAIMSVNYRLAPENPLPAAYDDGVKSLVWLRQQALSRDNEFLTSKCNFSSIFLAGDSAGANIAYNVAIRLSGLSNLRPLDLKGLILLQPFFGGESRTQSEKYMVQPPRSALTLAASDTYWRLSLPAGANRDHPWCNPLAKGAGKLEDFPHDVPTMICLSEMDILKDRNLEFCAAMARAGKKVEHVVHKDVGHAFQILNKSSISQTRINELICVIKSFISR
ncbi:probable carboxylesterase 17 [Olea europaea var. sylvestris]|uniref:Probable carboxylesterase 6 n=1 Tax=Olea europaea subsp. europaea TaxID=158383 RepID=A0A8S0R543_OLEEU|nr:probable carboxylesterase 17 [Olea europaea var. sylvestris]CAA2974047.1 probable carboxylesterase 6 [Olea europaea subsp. europaea]